MRLSVVSVVVFLALSQLSECINSRFNFTFVQAHTKYKYAILNTDKFGEIVDVREAEDTVLLVAVDESMLIGPAQLKQRLHKGDIDQMCEANVTKLKELDDRKVINVKFNPELDHTNFSPDFGFFTQVNNIARITFDVDMFVKRGFPIISRTLELNAGDVLSAATIQGERVISTATRIIDFAYCAREFDREELFTVDPDEQLCVKTVFMPETNSLPNTMLFAVRGDRVYLVGNVSKSSRKFSIATIISKHCESFIDDHGPHICQ